MVTIRILTDTHEPADWIRHDMGQPMRQGGFYVWVKQLADSMAGRMKEALTQDASREKPAFEAAFVEDKTAPGGFSLIAGEMLARRRRAQATLLPLSATPREISSVK